MANALYVLANATDLQVTYQSVEYTADYQTFSPMSVTRVTGSGSGGDFVKLSKCSADTYYDKHHATITVGAQTLYIWVNDDESYAMYSNISNGFAGASRVPGDSQKYDNCMLFVYFDVNNNLALKTSHF